MVTVYDLNEIVKTIRLFFLIILFSYMSYNKPVLYFY